MRSLDVSAGFYVERDQYVYGESRSVSNARSYSGPVSADRGALVLSESADRNSMFYSPVTGADTSLRIQSPCDTFRIPIPNRT
jgi:hypothetical protein